jgi:hypothetical protein
MKAARRESASPVIGSGGGMGGVLDELRALKNSGLVSTKLPAPTDGGEKPVVIDVVAEEFVEPEATVEPEASPSTLHSRDLCSSNCCVCRMSCCFLSGR